MCVVFRGVNMQVVGIVGLYRLIVVRGFQFSSGSIAS